MLPAPIQRFISMWLFMAAITPLVGFSQSLSIELIGPDTSYVEVYHPFEDPGVQARDSMDGDLSHSIVRSGVINTGKLGFYTIRYSIENQGGVRAEVIRTIQVGDSTAPKISGLNGPILRLPPNANWSMLNQLKFIDNYSDPSLLKMRVDTLFNNINYDSVGIYTFVVTTRDSMNNVSKPMELIVVVDHPFICFPTDEYTSNELLVYPNPSDGNFQILQYSKEGVTLRVFSAGGQLVHESQRSNYYRQHISLVLVPGLYFVETTDGDHVQVKKLIIH